MSTNEEKSRLAKLLQDLEVAEERLPERCRPLLKELQEKYSEECIEERAGGGSEECVNPYIPDKVLLEETERKLQELVAGEKRPIKESEGALSTVDPKRSWRTNSSKEKLLRIDSELKRFKTSVEKTGLLAEGDKSSVNCCEEDRAKTFAPTGLQ